jgi:kinesin family protein C2/C3
MLVQITSDIKSYSESLSTLKFAERVSGVELGVAKSSKDGRDVRELMEQVINFANFNYVYIYFIICFKIKSYIIFTTL